MKKTLFMLLILCSGCATTVTKVSPTETFPGYEMRTYAFGNAEMARSAQSFSGKLTVMSPDGKSITVDMSNGQNSEGLNAKGIDAVVNASIKAVLSAFALPVAP